MDFTVGKGFEMKDGVASVPAAELDDTEAMNAFAELKSEVESRGLWLPENVGQIAVAEVIEPPADLRSQILANAERDIEYTNTVFEIINDGRRKNKRFDIIPAGEQKERLEDQLTDQALETASQLHKTEKRPLMPVPALPDAITAEELITAIDKSSKHGLYSWAGRLPFLKKFPIDTLTGYDEERAESGAIALIETGYDSSRQGTRDQQLETLTELRETFPDVSTAPILATATLAQRYNGRPSTWKGIYTRAIEVDPVRLDYFDSVVDASVRANGIADLDSSDVRSWVASRRQAGL